MMPQFAVRVKKVKDILTLREHSENTEDKTHRKFHGLHSVAHSEAHSGVHQPTLLALCHWSGRHVWLCLGRCAPDSPSGYKRMLCA